MTTLSIQPSYPIFTNSEGGPLESGYIWVGAANLDPQTNPTNVYADAALTTQISQPIRTIDGYPVNNGTPIRLYVNNDYSLRVLDRHGNLVYSAPTATERYNRAVVDISFVPLTAVGDGAQTFFPLPSGPLMVFINGVYQTKNTYSVVIGGLQFSEAPPLNSTIEFLI